MSLQSKRAEISAYLRRSWNYIKHQSQNALVVDQSWKREMPLFHFKTKDYLQQWKVGCDADIGLNFSLSVNNSTGGFSEAFWGLTAHNTALFWGTISTEIPPKSNFRVSGYAGVRSLERPWTLFHQPTFDITPFRYITIRAKGDTKQWFLNIQSESIYPQYLWQHRLRFKTPGEWETIKLPIRDFVFTAYGNVMKKQIPMSRNRVKTIGFSILRQPGDFSLEIDWIKATNTMSTYGDIDILLPDEYRDKEGNIKKLEAGQTLESVKQKKIPLFTLFPKSEKDKKWF